MLALGFFALATVLALAICYLQREQHRYETRELRRQLERVERERADLLNRLMYVSNKPWELPPGENISLGEDELSGTTYWYPELELVEE